MKSVPRIAVTLGDVAGIGPEVVVRALEELRDSDIGPPLVIGHPEFVRRAAELIGVKRPPGEVSWHISQIRDFRERLANYHACGAIACIDPFDDRVLEARHGEVCPIAGEAAYRYLLKAIELAQAGIVDAIVTAPLNKEALHLAGHDFPGHTEILAKQCGVSEFAMMLHLPESAIAAWRPLMGTQTTEQSNARHGLSIAHVTLHTSVASVPGLLNQKAIEDTIMQMSGFLHRMGCTRSKIAVAALNPHGGEHGLFGDEEATIIEPAIARCRSWIPYVYGPLPVDTLMRRAVAGEFDGIVAMYHDQGHIPIKLIGFDRAVNITLGLPIIRTSPTHGTAFDRAWRSDRPSDATGMVEAIRMAHQLAARRS